MSRANHANTCNSQNLRVVTGIDVLRGLFAILVVFGHATAVVLDLRGSAGGGLLTRILETVMRQGLLWVIGFFVISGFCIHRSVAGMMASGGFDAALYFRARVTRIYPFYLIGLVFALAAGLLARPEAVTAGKTLASLTMTQGFFDMLPAFSISWSLTNEMAYYFVYGWLVTRMGGDWRRVFTQGLLWSFVGTVVLLALWLVVDGFGSGIFPPWVVPLMMPIWMAGAAVACYWERLSGLFRSSRRLWLLLSISFALVYPFYVWYWLCSNRLLSLQLINLAWIPCFCLLLLALPRLSFLDSRTARQLAGRLGLLSYPLYLLHSPLQSLLGTFCHEMNWFGGMPLVAKWSMHAVVPVLLCWFIAIPVESRLLVWRERYLKSSLKRP